MFKPPLISTDEFQRIGKEWKVKFLHFRWKDGEAVDPRGGYTVAYKIVEDSNTTPRIDYAVAKCCQTDNYNKHVGRAKAAGRLDSDKQKFSIRVPIDEIDSVEDILRQFIIKEAESHYDNVRTALVG